MLGFGLGINSQETAQADWWLPTHAGAVRAADYVNRRYMSQGKAVDVGAMVTEARNTPQVVTNMDGSFSIVAALEPAIGAGVGLQNFVESTNLKTGTPIETETVTVLDATEYTISLAGSGAATLSGAATGVASDGISVTFTTSGTSLAVTISGSPDYCWLEKQAFAGPPLEPGQVRDASEVTAVQATILGENLLTDQSWNLISGVTKTDTHIVYDGTAANGSLAVRVLGLPLVEGDQAELSYQVEDYVTGEIGLTISLNPSPSREIVTENKLVTQMLTVGSSQQDRLVVVGSDGFEGKILSSSISVRKVTTLAFPGYNPTEGTFIFEYLQLALEPVQRILTLHDGTSANRMTVYDYAVNSKQQAFVTNSVAGDGAQLDGTTPRAIGTIIRFGLAYKQDDIAFVTDGGAVAKDLSSTPPLVTAMALGGNGYATGSNQNGILRSEVYFPTRLTDAQLQAYTA